MSEGYLTPEELAALRETFRLQAEELLETYGEATLELERAEGREETLRTLQRVVHTLKGDSMALEMSTLAELAHRLEDLFGALREGRAAVGQETVDLLLACGDAMGALVREDGEASVDTAGLLARIDDALDGSSRPSATPRYRLQLVFAPECHLHSAGAVLIRQRLERLGRIVEASPDPDGQVIEDVDAWSVVLETDAAIDAIEKAGRVPAVCERVVVEAELDAASGPAGPVAEGAGARGPARGGEHLRVEAEKIDRIINLVGELVIARSMIAQSAAELRSGDADGLDRLERASDFLDRTLGELQTAALAVRMVPVERVFRRFPRMVRELAQASGKRVELELEGASTELDKSIVDALGEPLLHLVRNAIDHGIEPPDERRRKGKPPAGRLRLAAYYEGNHVYIVAEDDGRGIDVERVAARAVELGLLSGAELRSAGQKDILSAIYRTGFSTRDEVSAISGRGIGLDVVRESIEALKGTIELSTEKDRGTRFVIRLPLTLAIQRAILVDAASRSFAVPLTGVLEIVRVFPEELATVVGRRVMRLRDDVVPVVWLAEALGLDAGAHAATGRAFVLLVGDADRRMGLVVDGLRGEHELVVKPIDDPLARHPGVSGASILGDGRVVLILNLRGLLDEALSRVGRAERGDAPVASGVGG